jgi:glycosyltransferase involved in cell wall biosynthesis
MSPRVEERAPPRARPRPVPRRARLRIAMVAFGSWDSTAALAGALAPHVDLHLLVPRACADYIGAGFDPRVTIGSFDEPRLRRPLGQARMAKDIVGRIQRIDPDLVHVQQGHPWFNFALGALRRYPLVVTVHEPRLGRGERHSARALPQFAVGRAFGRADQLIVHGGDVAGAVAALGIDPAGVHVCPYAFPALARERPSERPTAPTVLFFGRIFPYKGLRELIRAAPRVIDRVPTARFVVAGDGHELARCRPLMDASASFDVREGFVTRDERDALFARASVVALPYVRASASGIVPITQLHRRPVVATAVGALPEAVEHGHTGLIVPPGDHEALAAALATLLSDDRLSDAMGQAARLRLESDSARAAGATLDVYERALAAARR